MAGLHASLALLGPLSWTCVQRSKKLGLRCVMSKRKLENEPEDRNVKQKTDNFEIQILPSIPDAQTVPSVFQFEEVTMSPTSSRMHFVLHKLTFPVLAPAVAAPKKKKAKPKKTTPKAKAPVFPTVDSSSGFALPVAIDPATGLPITQLPASGQYTYSGQTYSYASPVSGLSYSPNCQTGNSRRK